jgi:formylglycine-generating enzyme required for sulfatase activity
MTWIPPGESTIGTRPQDVVTLAGSRKDAIEELAWETSPWVFRHRGYFIGTYEVTNAQYALYLEGFKTTYKTGTSALASLRDIATRFVFGGDKARAQSDKTAWRQIYDLNKEAITAALPDADPAKLENEALPPDIDLVVYEHYIPDNWVGAKPPEGLENHPVRFVSYLDAAAFAMWAGWHVPTEAEWENAGRGTDRREYPWGNDWVEEIDADGKRIFEKRLVWANSSPVDKNQQPLTAPVDSFPEGKSPFGLHHLLGNVAEWTSSWVNRYPNAFGVDKTPPHRLGYEGDFAKVIRGGSLGDLEKLALRLPARNLRGSGRHGPSRPVNRFPNVGFRVAAYPEPGRDRLEPLVEAMSGGWFRDEVIPIDRPRFVGAQAVKWAPAGEAVVNHVYALGRAHFIVFAPRAAIFVDEEKASARSVAELVKESAAENPVILGVFHSDIGLEGVDVPAPEPEEVKKKRRKDEVLPPHTAKGKLPAGSYIIGLHHGRVGLFRKSLEFAAYFRVTKAIEAKNLGKNESPPPSTLTLDPDADLVSRCSFWIRLGGKGSKPEEGARVSFQFETESGMLAKVGPWR